MNLMLARQIPEGLMDAYNPSSFQDYVSIDLGTLYFTAHRDDPHGAAIPFNHGVDPNGFLSSMANDKYFHGMDNQVLYYTMLQNNKNGQPAQ